MCGHRPWLRHRGLPNTPWPQRRGHEIRWRAVELGYSVTDFAVGCRHAVAWQSVRNGAEVPSDVTHASPRLDSRGRSLCTVRSLGSRLPLHRRRALGGYRWLVRLLPLAPPSLGGRPSLVPRTIPLLRSTWRR